MKQLCKKFNTLTFSKNWANGFEMSCCSKIKIQKLHLRKPFTTQILTEHNNCDAIEKNCDVTGKCVMQQNRSQNKHEVLFTAQCYLRIFRVDTSSPTTAAETCLIFGCLTRNSLFTFHCSSKLVLSFNQKTSIFQILASFKQRKKSISHFYIRHCSPNLRKVFVDVLEIPAQPKHIVNAAKRVWIETILQSYFEFSFVFWILPTKSCSWSRCKFIAKFHNETVLQWLAG